MELMKVVVIVPTYKEKENIGLLISALLEQFKKMPYDAHILVVDDNSPDGTAANWKKERFGSSVSKRNQIRIV